MLIRIFTHKNLLDNFAIFIPKKSFTPSLLGQSVFGKPFLCYSVNKQVLFRQLETQRGIAFEKIIDVPGIPDCVRCSDDMVLNIEQKFKNELEQLLFKHVTNKQL